MQSEGLEAYMSERIRNYWAVTPLPPEIKNLSEIRQAALECGFPHFAYELHEILEILGDFEGQLQRKLIFWLGHEEPGVEFVGWNPLRPAFYAAIELEI